MRLPRRLACTLGVAIAAAPWPALAQRLGGGGEFEPPLVRLAVGLVLCTLIAVIAALALRRLMRTGAVAPAGARLTSWMRVAPRKLRIIEAHRLSPHADVCVFACDEREYLVIVSNGGATLLREQDVRPQPAQQ